MVFCNQKTSTKTTGSDGVTILILVDGFLQFMDMLECFCSSESHNPYFSRWFSAIKNTDTLFIELIGSQSLF